MYRWCRISKTGKQKPEIVPSKIVKESRMRAFNHAVLRMHNLFRASHDVRGVQLNPFISKAASQWAKKLAEMDRLEYNIGCGYGQNIFESRGVNVHGNEVVQSWYDEVEYYDFEHPDLSPLTRSFTQLVWADAREIGIGAAISRKGALFIVVNYSPPGNIREVVAEKVKPLVLAIRPNHSAECCRTIEMEQ